MDLCLVSCLDRDHVERLEPPAVLESRESRDCQDLIDPFVFNTIISCVEPCSWVEQQDV